MKIGIVTTTVRDGRKSLDIAQWVNEVAQKRNDQNVSYEIVDIKDYELPIFASNTTQKDVENITKFKEKIASFDGFVFVVAEYNHSPSGVFKNALDYLMVELNNKAAGYVGYGGVGGARAIEQLRLINAEQALATVRKNVNLFLAYDFVNFTEFKPNDYQLAPLNEMLDQLLVWAKALKTTRE